MRQKQPYATMKVNSQTLYWPEKYNRKENAGSVSVYFWSRVAKHYVSVYMRVYLRTQWPIEHQGHYHHYWKKGLLTSCGSADECTAVPEILLEFWKKEDLAFINQWKRTDISALSKYFGRSVMLKMLKASGSLTVENMLKDYGICLNVCRWSLVDMRIFKAHRIYHQFLKPLFSLPISQRK